MTVGQHDTAWMNVMDRVIPNAGSDLNQIKGYIKLGEMRQTLKDLYEAGVYSKEEYIKDLKELAKAEGFKFNEESK